MPVTANALMTALGRENPAMSSLLSPLVQFLEINVSLPHEITTQVLAGLA